MNSTSLISHATPLLAHESSHISAHQSQALLRLVEAAPEVQRLSQFFSWLQSHVQVLLPHGVMACGHYERSERRLHFDVLPCLVLQRPLLDALGDAGSPLLAACVNAWVQGDGHARVIDLARPRSNAFALAADAGLSQLSCHGVARPGRLHELESFFVFAHAEALDEDTLRYVLELLLPQLHAVFGRVRGLVRSQSGKAEGGAEPPRIAGALTGRELQILAGVREGRSNLVIGETLNISALTVKNHVQKILRKLGAANRAQAVAIALAQNLFAGLAESR